MEKDGKQKFFAHHGDTLKRVAKREHKGAVTMTVEDLEQDLHAFFLQNLNSVRGFSPEGVEGLAVKQARKTLLKERIDYMYFSGSFLYTPAMVEVYLQDAVWQELDCVPDIDGRMDVQAAVRELPLDTQRLLFRKYALGESPANASPERKRIERAIETICHSLNLGLKRVKVELEDLG